MAGTHSAAIAVAAARLIVEEGMEYGPAKRRAARDLGLNARNGELPGNDEIEDEVRAYLDLFHADTQPAELAELRRIAALWMEKLAAFRPHLTGAVWRGTATRLSSVFIDLFCDDSKSAEIALIDMRVDYDVSSIDGPRGRVLDVLNLHVASAAIAGGVHVALTVRDYDDLRGALHRDARGRSDRGDLAALRAREAGA
ncbi:MAG TPA: hypothetical protein VGO85_13700 [Caldimonas sp.]|jgi:hypothetical protein|nr:hypothetical protein [Caldimonas sp.]